MGRTNESVQPLRYPLQWQVRWLALLHDTIAMAVDHGGYEDELIEHALDRIDQQMRDTLRPENHRLVEAHRKYPPPQ
jgi:hypothetical protein